MDRGTARDHNYRREHHKWLRLIFAQHGLPEEVVSDDGPQFVSTEFAEFMNKNGIKNTLVPPYHPQSNGAAERSVRVVKEALVKQVLEGNKSRSMKHRLADFLLRYRTTPHSTTGAAPAELLMRRRLHTRLSLVKPDLAQVVESKQNKQKEYKLLKSHKERLFSENDIVKVRNTQANSNTEQWILGKVVKVCRPRTYLVRTGHKTRHVHADHLIIVHMMKCQMRLVRWTYVSLSYVSNLAQLKMLAWFQTVYHSRQLLPQMKRLSPCLNQESVNTSSPVVLRRTQRIRKPVDRLTL